MTAAGAAAGGAVLAFVGVRMAFVLDALSFVASALLIASLRTPTATAATAADEAADPGFREGLRYLAAHERTGSHPPQPGERRHGVAMASLLPLLAWTLALPWMERDTRTH